MTIGTPSLKGVYNDIQLHHNEIWSEEINANQWLTEKQNVKRADNLTLK